MRGKCRRGDCRGDVRATVLPSHSTKSHSWEYKRSIEAELSAVEVSTTPIVHNNDKKKKKKNDDAQRL